MTLSQQLDRPGTVDPTPARRVARLALRVLVVVLAFGTAVFAALISRMCWRNGVVTVPYGLILGAAASFSVIWLARCIGRGFSFVAAVAWLLGLAVIVKGTGAGSFVIAGDGLGWGFLVVATIAALAPTVWVGKR